MEMEQEVMRLNFAHPVPLFPLPHCVLLPHATIPLHIFEPRYRAMTADSLDSRGLIAMASFEDHRWKQDYHGTPPLRPHVCVSYIVKHDRFDDGQYNLWLQGICRASIVEEIDHKSYRQAILKPTETQTTMEIDLESHRQRIETLLRDNTLKSLASISKIHNWLSCEIPTTAMVDLAIMTLCNELEQRYQMLAESNALVRTEWLEHHLRRTRKLLAIADRFGTAKCENGMHLN